jgi:cytochrome c-type biogenesis protein
MDPFDISYAGALLAGVLSFASPCVLPLIPAYLGFLGGVTFDELAGEQAQLSSRRRVFFAALAFVLGFATVFIALGATASTVSRQLIEHFDVLGKVAGTIIVVLGLHYAGVIRIPFLNYEARVEVSRRPAGLMGAYIVGLAFAFGWTPCVGPVLASILMVAGAGDSLGYGVSLLTAYALGMGLPFLAAAAAARPFFAFAKRFRKHMRIAQVTMGVLMIATGVMIFAGSISVVSQWLLDTFPGFAGVG